MNSSRTYSRSERIMAFVLSFVMVFSMFANTGLFNNRASAANEEDAICGMIEHKHSDLCYKMPEGEYLVCSENQGSKVHTHDTFCYDSEGKLICHITPIKYHHHDDSCSYVEQRLICGKEDGEQHIHTDECYISGSQMQEYLAQAANHIHADECYTWYLSCTNTDEKHVHTRESNCFTKTLTCGYDRAKATMVSADADAKILFCGKQIGDTEHQHNENCYKQFIVTCDEQDTSNYQKHQHTRECWSTYAVSPVPTCGKEEHTHVELCYPVKKVLPTIDVTFNDVNWEGNVVESINVTLDPNQEVSANSVESQIESSVYGNASVLVAQLDGKTFRDGTSLKDCKYFKVGEDGGKVAYSLASLVDETGAIELFTYNYRLRINMVPEGMDVEEEFESVPPVDIFARDSKALTDEQLDYNGMSLTEAQYVDKESRVSVDLASLAKSGLTENEELEISYEVTTMAEDYTWIAWKTTHKVLQADGFDYFRFPVVSGFDVSTTLGWVRNIKSNAQWIQYRNAIANMEIPSISGLKYGDLLVTPYSWNKQCYTTGDKTVKLREIEFTPEANLGSRHNMDADINLPSGYNISSIEFHNGDKKSSIFTLYDPNLNSTQLKNISAFKEALNRVGINQNTDTSVRSLGDSDFLKYKRSLVSLKEMTLSEFNALSADYTCGLYTVSVFIDGEIRQVEENVNFDLSGDCYPIPSLYKTYRLSAYGNAVLSDLVYRGYYNRCDGCFISYAMTRTGSSWMHDEVSDELYQFNRQKIFFKDINQYNYYHYHQIYIPRVHSFTTYEELLNKLKQLNTNTTYPVTLDGKTIGSGKYNSTFTTRLSNAPTKLYSISCNDFSYDSDTKTFSCVISDKNEFFTLNHSNRDIDVVSRVNTKVSLVKHTKVPILQVSGDKRYFMSKSDILAMLDSCGIKYGPVKTEWFKYATTDLSSLQKSTYGKLESDSITLMTNNGEEEYYAVTDGTNNIFYFSESIKTISYNDTIIGYTDSAAKSVEFTVEPNRSGLTSLGRVLQYTSNGKVSFTVGLDRVDIYSYEYVRDKFLNATSSTTLYFSLDDEDKNFSIPYIHLFDSWNNRKAVIISMKDVEQIVNEYLQPLTVNDITIDSQNSNLKSSYALDFSCNGNKPYANQYFYFRLEDIEKVCLYHKKTTNLYTVSLDGTQIGIGHGVESIATKVDTNLGKLYSNPLWLNFSYNNETGDLSIGYVPGKISLVSEKYSLEHSTSVKVYPHALVNGQWVNILGEGQSTYANVTLPYYSQWVINSGKANTRFISKSQLDNIYSNFNNYNYSGMFTGYVAPYNGERIYGYNFDGTSDILFDIMPLQKSDGEWYIPVGNEPSELHIYYAPLGVRGETISETGIRKSSYTMTSSTSALAGSSFYKLEYYGEDSEIEIKYIQRNSKLKINPSGRDGMYITSTDDNVYLLLRGEDIAINNIDRNYFVINARRESTSIRKQHLSLKVLVDDEWQDILPSDYEFTIHTRSALDTDLLSVCSSDFILYSELESVLADYKIESKSHLGSPCIFIADEDGTLRMPIYEQNYNSGNVQYVPVCDADTIYYVPDSNSSWVWLGKWNSGVDWVAQNTTGGKLTEVFKAKNGFYSISLNDNILGYTTIDYSSDPTRYYNLDLEDNIRGNYFLDVVDADKGFDWKYSEDDVSKPEDEKHVLALTNITKPVKLFTSTLLAAEAQGKRKVNVDIILDDKFTTIVNLELNTYGIQYYRGPDGLVKRRYMVKFDDLYSNAQIRSYFDYYDTTIYNESWVPAEDTDRVFGNIIGESIDVYADFQLGDDGSIYIPVEYSNDPLAASRIVLLPGNIGETSEVSGSVEDFTSSHFYTINVNDKRVALFTASGGTVSLDKSDATTTEEVTACSGGCKYQVALQDNIVVVTLSEITSRVEIYTTKRAVSEEDKAVIRVNLNILENDKWKRVTPEGGVDLVTYKNMMVTTKNSYGDASIKSYVTPISELSRIFVDAKLPEYFYTAGSGLFTSDSADLTDPFKSYNGENILGFADKDFPELIKANALVTQGNSEGTGTWYLPVGNNAATDSTSITNLYFFAPPVKNSEADAYPSYDRYAVFSPASLKDYGAYSIVFKIGEEVYLETPMMYNYTKLISTNVLTDWILDSGDAKVASNKEDKSQVIVGDVHSRVVITADSDVKTMITTGTTTNYSSDFYIYSPGFNSIRSTIANIGNEYSTMNNSDLVRVGEGTTVPLYSYSDEVYFKFTDLGIDKVLKPYGFNYATYSGKNILGILNSGATNKVTLLSQPVRGLADSSKDDMSEISWYAPSAQSTSGGRVAWVYTNVEYDEDTTGSEVSLSSRNSVYPVFDSNRDSSGNIVRKLIDWVPAGENYAYSLDNATYVVAEGTCNKTLTPDNVLILTGVQSYIDIFKISTDVTQTTEVPMSFYVNIDGQWEEREQPIKSIQWSEIDNAKLLSSDYTPVVGNARYVSYDVLKSSFGGYLDISKDEYNGERIFATSSDHKSLSNDLVPIKVRIGGDSHWYIPIPESTTGIYLMLGNRNGTSEGQPLKYSDINDKTQFTTSTFYTMYVEGNPVNASRRVDGYEVEPAQVLYGNSAYIYNDGKEILNVNGKYNEYTYYNDYVECSNVGGNLHVFLKGTSIEKTPEGDEHPAAKTFKFYALIDGKWCQVGESNSMSYYGSVGSQNASWASVGGEMVKSHFIRLSEFNNIFADNTNPVTYGVREADDTSNHPDWNYGGFGFDMDSYDGQRAFATSSSEDTNYNLNFYARQFEIDGNVEWFIPVNDDVDSVYFFAGELDNPAGDSGIPDFYTSADFIAYGSSNFYTLVANHYTGTEVDKSLQYKVTLRGKDREIDVTSLHVDGNEWNYVGSCDEFVTHGDTLFEVKDIQGPISVANAEQPDTGSDDYVRLFIFNGKQELVQIGSTNVIYKTPMYSGSEYYVTQEEVLKMLRRAEELDTYRKDAEEQGLLLLDSQSNGVADGSYPTIGTLQSDTQLEYWDGFKLLSGKVVIPLSANSECDGHIDIVYLPGDTHMGTPTVESEQHAARIDNLAVIKQTKDYFTDIVYDDTLYDSVHGGPFYNRAGMSYTVEIPNVDDAVWTGRFSYNGTRIKSYNSYDHSWAYDATRFKGDGTYRVECSDLVDSIAFTTEHLDDTSSSYVSIYLDGRLTDIATVNGVRGPGYFSTNGLYRKYISQNTVWDTLNTYNVYLDGRDMETQNNFFVTDRDNYSTFRRENKVERLGAVNKELSIPFVYTDTLQTANRSRILYLAQDWEDSAVSYEKRDFIDRNTFYTVKVEDRVAENSIGYTSASRTDYVGNEDQYIAVLPTRGTEYPWAISGANNDTDAIILNSDIHQWVISENDVGGQEEISKFISDNIDVELNIDVPSGDAKLSTILSWLCQYGNELLVKSLVHERLDVGSTVIYVGSLKSKLFIRCAVDAYPQFNVHYFVNVPKVVMDSTTAEEAVKWSQTTAATTYYTNSDGTTSPYYSKYGTNEALNLQLSEKSYSKNAGDVITVSSITADTNNGGNADKVGVVDNNGDYLNKGGKFPENGKGDLNPEPASSKNLYFYNIGNESGDAYTYSVLTLPTLSELYRNQTYYYDPYPSTLYFDILRESKNYVLKNIWIQVNYPDSNTEWYTNDEVTQSVINTWYSKDKGKDCLDGDKDRKYQFKDYVRLPVDPDGYTGNDLVTGDGDLSEVGPTLGEDDDIILTPLPSLDPDDGDLLESVSSLYTLDGEATELLPDLEGDGEDLEELLPDVPVGDIVDLKPGNSNSDVVDINGEIIKPGLDNYVGYRWTISKDKNGKDVPVLWYVYSSPETIPFKNIKTNLNYNIWVHDGVTYRMEYNANTTDTQEIPVTMYDYDVGMTTSAEEDNYPDDEKNTFRSYRGVNSLSNYYYYTSDGTKVVPDENTKKALFKYGNDNTSGLRARPAYYSTSDPMYSQNRWNGNALNVYNKAIIKNADGTTGPFGGQDSYKGGTFGMVTGLDTTFNDNGEIIGYEPRFDEDILQPHMFADDVSDLEGIRKFDNYKLGFARQGDTFILSTISKDTDNVVQQNLNYLYHPYTNAGWGANDQHYTKIFTNDFWPLSDVPNVSGVNDILNRNKIKYTDSPKGFPPMDNDELTKSFTLPVGSTLFDNGANPFFGMKYQMKFSIPENYIGPLDIFVYGDDDIWIFLDDELVFDIGGVRSTFGEYVNLWDYMRDVDDLYVYGSNDGEHTLSVFFTERGNSGSTCWMMYTLPLDNAIGVRSERQASSLSLQKQVNQTEMQTNDSYTFKVDFYRNIAKSSSSEDNWVEVGAQEFSYMLLDETGNVLSSDGKDTVLFKADDVTYNQAGKPMFKALRFKVDWNQIANANNGNNALGKDYNTTALKEIPVGDTSPADSVFNYSYVDDTVYENPPKWAPVDSLEASNYRTEGVNLPTFTGNKNYIGKLYVDNYTLLFSRYSPDSIFSPKNGDKVGKAIITNTSQMYYRLDEGVSTTDDVWTGDIYLPIMGQAGVMRDLPSQRTLTLKDGQKAIFPYMDTRIKYRISEVIDNRFTNEWRITGGSYKDKNGNMVALKNGNTVQLSGEKTDVILTTGVTKQGTYIEGLVNDGDYSIDNPGYTTDYYFKVDLLCINTPFEAFGNELPETGSVGTKVIYTVGIMLALPAGFALRKRNRKERRTSKK